MQATLADPGAHRVRLSLLPGFACLLILSSSLAVGQGAPTLAPFWFFGLAFGVILQRSRLCFASAFRDLFLTSDGRAMRGILLGIAVATVGFALIELRGLPNPAFGGLPRGAHLMPLGLQLIGGGIAFGIGMVLAGGCISGTLYRVGEGYVASWVALGGILLGLVAATHTWNWWWLTTGASAPVVWLPSLFGYGGALLLALAVLGAAAVLTVWWELRSGPQPAFALPRVAPPPAASLREALARAYEQVARRGWPFAMGAVALGVLNILAYQFSHPLGVTGELSAWANRGAGLFGALPPELLGTGLLAGCLLVFETGTPLLGEGFFLDSGLVVGAFAAAALAGEFKLRFPSRPVRYVQSVGGGALMGYGAGIAAGCTIGAFFSAVPSLGLNGFVFGLALLAGAGLGVQAIRRIA